MNNDYQPKKDPNSNFDPTKPPTGASVASSK